MPVNAAAHKKTVSKVTVSAETLQFLCVLLLLLLLCCCCCDPIASDLILRDGSYIGAA
jgi:hypothetical protein